MTLPNKYLIASAGPIATYAFTDLASGRGYAQLYGLVTDDNETLLVTQTNPSAAGKSQDTQVGNGADANLVEKNFDYEFNETSTVAGRAFVFVTLDVEMGGTGFIKARFLHVDASATETQIATQVASDSYSAGTTTSTNITLSLSITRTDFLDGEKLRLEIQLWGGSSGGNKNITIFHDPADRPSPSTPNPATISSNNAQLITLVPFVIYR